MRKAAEACIKRAPPCRLLNLNNGNVPPNYAAYQMTFGRPSGKGDDKDEDGPQAIGLTGITDWVPYFDCGPDGLCGEQNRFARLHSGPGAGTGPGENHRQWD